MCDTRDLNLRGVDVTLVTSLKRCAIESGVTLKDYCVEALQSAVNTDLDMLARGESLRVILRQHLGHATHGTAPNPAGSHAVAANTPGMVSTQVRPRITGTVYASQLPRPEHDPRTCRLYGCGLCASLARTGSPG